MEGKSNHKINIRERIGELAIAAGAATVAMGAVAGIAKVGDIVKSGHVQMEDQSMDAKYSAIKTIPKDERLTAAQVLKLAASSADLIPDKEGVLIGVGVGALAIVPASAEALRRRKKAKD